MNELAHPAGDRVLIGVTGHRDLRSEEVPAIERVVRSLLRRVAALSTHHPRFVVSAAWPITNSRGE